MNGATMAKNIRRTGIPATVKGEPNPAYPIAREINIDEEREARNSLTDYRGPTAERVARATGALVIGGDARGALPVYTMRDTTLERALKRGAISAAECAALEKYHHHWYHAGLEVGIGSVDLNRVFASDPGSMSGMAKTEAQAFHRAKYREARDILGQKTGIVADNVVCAGTSLEVAGYGIGYNSPFRAREGALKHLQRAGDLLERHWGLR